MNKFKLLILWAFVLLGISTGKVSAQWNQVLTGQISLIDELSVVNKDVIWTKDQTGNSVSVSIDGGNSWTTRSFPTNLVNGGIGGLCAVSATTAYVVISQGAKGIYKTTDGGNSWTLQSGAFESTASFPDMIYFWNENEGVAIGDGYPNENFEIYTTTNGGNQWNRVSATDMPSGNYEWSYSSNQNLKVRDNSIYFLTSNGRIFKSANKGLNWSVINTPVENGQYLSFDFKDNANGILTSYNSPNDHSLYSTSDGGITWQRRDTTNCLRRLYYDSYHDVYFSVHHNYGMSYSRDNGASWTKHTSFDKSGINIVVPAPDGRLFAGGWSYVYNTINYEGVNLSLTKGEIKNNKTIDLTFSAIPDQTTAQEPSNYQIKYLEDNSLHLLSLQSATQDATDKRIIHLSMTDDLPLDTIYVYASNVKDNSGSEACKIFDQRIRLLNTRRSVQVNDAGTLYTFFTSAELKNIKELIVKGTIDARDFKLMRDSMKVLSNLDLTGANIAAYNGTEGTAAWWYSTEAQGPMRINPKTATTHATPLPNTSKQAAQSMTKYYPADEIPCFAFDIPDVRNGEWVTATLSKIALPNTVTSIGDYALSACEDLSVATYPNTIQSIGKGAFFGCSALPFVYIPASVTSIGSEAFIYCDSIYVDNANQNFSSEDGVLYDKMKTKLISCPSIRTGSFTIPSSVTSIGNWAFEYCYDLTSITLPSSLTTIGGGSFWDCTKLTSVSIPSTVNSIGPSAFAYCTGLTSLYANAANPPDVSSSATVFESVDTLRCILFVPTGSKALYRNANQWGSFMNVMDTNLNSFTDVTSLKPYYLIGLGDAKWNNSKSGLGASVFPLNLIKEKVYDSAGKGVYVYSGYIQASQDFKIIGNLGSWTDQWGLQNGIYIHNDSGSGNIKVPADGYYTIVLNSIDNLLEIEAINAPDKTYNSLNLMSEADNYSNGVSLTPVETVNNHTWYGTLTFNSDYSFGWGGAKFLADKDWSYSWGGISFPYGVGKYGENNIPYSKGTYTVLFNDLNGGYYFIDQLSTDIINGTVNDGIKIYPNPAIDYMTIETDKNVQSIELINLAGQTVRKYAYQKTISLSGIPSGSYLIRLNIEGIKQHLKQIVIR